MRPKFGAGTKLSSYRELAVWQKSVDLTIEIYRITKAFPRDERFGMVAQVQRAAVSVPANSAEGYYRTHRGDYLRFLSIAKGSLAELETHLVIAGRLGYLSQKSLDSIEVLMAAVGRMLTSLINSLAVR